MNPDPLDLLLSSYAKQPVPRTTVSRGDVWREIECRRDAGPKWRVWFGFTDVSDFLGRPTLAFSTLVFAALVGVIPAAVVAKAQNETRLAKQSIHFEAFSSRTAGIPGMRTDVGASDIER